MIWRKTKRSEKETDIRPWIYQMEVQGEDLWMQVSTGSVSNLKPELVMDAFAAFLGEELPADAYQVQREEVYADIGEDGNRVLKSLEDLGEEVE